MRKKKIDLSTVIKIALGEVGPSSLYDKELEKRILAVLREKQRKSIEIKRMKDILEFL